MIKRDISQIGNALKKRLDDKIASLERDVSHQSSRQLATLNRLKIRVGDMRTSNGVGVTRH